VTSLNVDDDDDDEGGGGGGGDGDDDDDDDNSLRNMMFYKYSFIPVLSDADYVLG
jgi:hypothetical protein